MVEAKFSAERFIEEYGDELRANNIFSEKLLACMARMANIMQEKGEKVSAFMFYGGMNVKASPSDIGLFLSSSKKSLLDKASIAIWLEPDNHRRSDEAELWCGEFGKKIQEMLEYEEKKVLLDNLDQFDPKDHIEKLLSISAKLSESLPALSLLVRKFEKSAERRYKKVIRDMKKTLA